MPSKTKRAPVAKAALPSIPKELLDQFVTGPITADAVNAASVVMGAELSHHLGYGLGKAEA